MTAAVTPPQNLGVCAVDKPTASPRRARLVVGVLLLVPAPGYASYRAGQDLAGRLDLPEQLAWAPVVVAAVAGAVVVAAGLARWRDHRRYGRNEIVAEADLDPQALALLDRVRARRRGDAAGASRGVQR